METYFHTIPEEQSFDFVERIAKAMEDCANIGDGDVEEFERRLVEIFISSTFNFPSSFYSMELYADSWCDWGEFANKQSIFDDMIEASKEFAEEERAEQYRYEGEQYYPGSNFPAGV